MAKTKLRPHNKIAQVLSSGNVVKVEDIKASFAADAKMTSLMYRLSTFIYDIRKYDNGIIKVFKNGRKVEAYQLVNYAEFNAEGHYVGKKTVAPAPVASTQPAQPETESV